MMLTKSVDDSSTCGARGSFRIPASGRRLPAVDLRCGGSCLMSRGDGYDRPSEHRRYFRVMEDILDDPKLAALSGDAFRAYFQILAMLNRTKSTDGTLVLNKFALMAATSKGRVDSARTLLERLADVGLMSVEHRADVALLTVPNWLKNQGFSSPTIPTPIPTPIPRVRTSVVEGEKIEEQGVSDRIPKPDPFNLPESIRADLNAWARKTHAWNEGVALAPNQIDFIKEQFDTWEPANSRMSPAKWAKAFKTIGQKQAAQGDLPRPGGKSKPSRYRDAGEVLAEARAKEADDHARWEEEKREAESVGQIIDFALASGGRE